MLHVMVLAATVSTAAPLDTQATDTVTPAPVTVLAAPGRPAFFSDGPAVYGLTPSFASSAERGAPMDDLEGRRPVKNFQRNMALARTGMTLGIVGLSVVGGVCLVAAAGGDGLDNLGAVFACAGTAVFGGGVALTGTMMAAIASTAAAGNLRKMGVPVARGPGYAALLTMLVPPASLTLSGVQISANKRANRDRLAGVHRMTIQPWVSAQRQQLGLTATF